METKWREPVSASSPRVQGVSHRGSKSLAGLIAGSLLATNLQTVLGIIQKHYLRAPEVHNLVLFLHSGMGTKGLPVNAGHDFKVVPLDYAEVAYENFIWLSV